MLFKYGVGAEIRCAFAICEVGWLGTLIIIPLEYVDVCLKHLFLSFAHEVI